MIYRLKHYILTVLGGALLLGCGGCQSEAQAKPTRSPAKAVYRVNAIKVSIPKDPLSLQYSGVATPVQTASLSFQMPGKIARINVKEGDTVKKGQKLAVIEKSRYQSAYIAAQAMNRQAEDAYGRLKQVYDKGSLPEIKWHEVVSQQQQAEASLQLAQENLRDCVLRAPSGGVVASKRIEIGANVLPNVMVMELVQLDNVFIRISVPENEIPYLKTGQQGAVTISAIGSKVFKATVDQIGVSASPLSKTYEVKLRVKNTERLIKPGMAAVARLNLEQPRQLPVVPLRAVQQNGGGEKFVYVIDKKNRTAIWQKVALGSFLKNDVYVTDGIKGGELVVVDGQHKLSPNTEIEFRILK